jgi:hypothetical protein
MVFIQPRILRDAIQANAETTSRMGTLQDAESEQKNKKKELLPLMPKQDGSILPELGSAPPAVTPTTPVPGRP